MKTKEHLVNETSFFERHKDYVQYLKEHSANVSRSIMWDAISSDFFTEIPEGHLVLNTSRKRQYWLDFSTKGSMGFVNKMGCKALLFFDKILAKMGGLFSGDIRNDADVIKVSPQLKKARCKLEDHSLVGMNKCKYNKNLILQWHDYTNIYPAIENKDQLTVVEIGAGAGILHVLIHHDFKARSIIVDLPEMISFSSACLQSVFPEARFIFPNEVNEHTSFEDYDFIFLFPDQINLVADNDCDLAVNCVSFGEMKKEETSEYLTFIQRVVKNGGYFYCSNRFRKNPENMGVGDTETREFFKYPWVSSNEDVLLDINPIRFKLSKGSYDHIVVDRLQKIVK